MTENNVHSLPRMSVEDLRTRRNAYDMLARLSVLGDRLLTKGEQDLFERGGEVFHDVRRLVISAPPLSVLMTLSSEKWKQVATEIEDAEAFITEATTALAD